MSANNCLLSREIDGRHVNYDKATAARLGDQKQGKRGSQCGMLTTIQVIERASIPLTLEGNV